MASLLIQHGAILTPTSPNENTIFPLHSVVYGLCDVSILKMMREKGIPMDQQNFQYILKFVSINFCRKETPLLIACKLKSALISGAIEYLLSTEEGLKSVNIPDQNGWYLYLLDIFNVYLPGHLFTGLCLIPQKIRKLYWNYWSIVELT